MFRIVCQIVGFIWVVDQVEEHFFATGFKGVQNKAYFGVYDFVALLKVFMSWRVAGLSGRGAGDFV
jgi:hypothetical protein